MSTACSFCRACPRTTGRRKLWKLYRPSSDSLLIRMPPHVDILLVSINWHGFRTANSRSICLYRGPLDPLFQAPSIHLHPHSKQSTRVSKVPKPFINQSINMPKMTGADASRIQSSQVSSLSFPRATSPPLPPRKQRSATKSRPRVAGT
jgi:hypothetical protein